MFHTILAGCDGFERGRRAAAMAEALTEATGARLLLVAAYAQAPVSPPDGYRAQRGRMDHAIRAVRDEVAPRALTSTVAALSPSHALRHVARHEHADLVVVGSHRRHGVGHLVNANHAMQVVHDAPCPVMVVPDGGDDVALRRIAVGFDGSPEARAALEVAADLARRAGASLRLRVVVPEPLPAWPLGWGLVPPADETLGVEAARREASELPGGDAARARRPGGRRRGRPRRPGRHPDPHERGGRPPRRRLAPLGGAAAGAARQHVRARGPPLRGSRAHRPAPGLGRRARRPPQVHATAT